MRFEADLTSLMRDLQRFDSRVRRRIERAAMVNFGKFAKPKVAAAVTQDNESLAASIEYRVGRTKARRGPKDARGRSQVIRPSAAFCAIGVVSGRKVVSESHGRKGKYEYPRYSSRTRNWPMHEANLARWYEDGFRAWRKGLPSNRTGKGWRKGLNGQGLGPRIYRQKWFERIVPGLAVQARAFLEQEIQASIADSSRHEIRRRAARVRRPA